MSPNDSVDQSDTESGSVETNTTLDEEGPSTDTIDDEHVSSANDEIENKAEIVKAEIQSMLKASQKLNSEFQKLKKETEEDNIKFHQLRAESEEILARLKTPDKQ